MADKTLTKDQLIEAIKGMTVLELSEMVKALEEEFGVSAAAPAAVAAAPVAAAAALAPPVSAATTTAPTSAPVVASAATETSASAQLLGLRDELLSMQLLAMQQRIERLAESLGGAKTGGKGTV